MELSTTNLLPFEHQRKTEFCGNLSHNQLWQWLEDLVSKLVGILSRVNHKGLYHGQKHCSICLLFTLHASHQTTDYPKTTKSVLTQTHMKHKIFEELISPFGIAPVEKAHKARTRWYRGPFRRFINTRLKKKKGMDRSNKKIYKCITANTSAIWQHAVHTTDELTSPSCWTGVIQKSLPLNEKY